MSQLPSHGRYPYSAITTPIRATWPGGKRLAVYLAVNLEHFRFDGGLGAALVPSDAKEPDILNYTWRDYGNRVGVWRMIDLFDALCLPASILVNSSIYEYCPEVMAALRARGDEVVGHGRTNSERQGILKEADECALIHEVSATILQAEGKAAKGWLGPWISESNVTPDLLQENGYTYCLDWCMDDRPVWLTTRQGRILSLPYPQELNDIPALVVRRHTASEFGDMIIDQFDEMLEQSASGSLVMGIALHPYIVGQPFRMKHLRRALQHIVARRDDIWITTAGAIADEFVKMDSAAILQR